MQLTKFFGKILQYRECRGIRFVRMNYIERKMGQAYLQGGPVRRGSTVHDFWITVNCVVVCFGFQDGDVSAYKFEVNS